MNAHDKDDKDFEKKVLQWLQDKMNIEERLEILEKSFKNKEISKGDYNMIREDIMNSYQPYQHPFYSQELLDAAKKGDKEFIIKLAGADLNITDEYGNTPLKLAAEAGHKELVTLLLNNGADPNIRSSKGNTALHGICSAPMKSETALDIANILLSRGADPTIKNKEGFTAARIAGSLGKEKESLAQLLLRRIQQFIGNRNEAKDPSLHLKWLLSGKKAGKKENRQGGIELQRGKKNSPRRNAS